MRPLVFNLHSNPLLAAEITKQLEAEEGVLNQRQFPDQESYLRIDSDCQQRDCVIYCNLYQPNDKIMSLLFLAETLRELGAKRIALVTPYLCYMRQDKRFQTGECVSAIPFGKLISNYFDHLITIDPHLHRIHHLDEVYQIPSQIVKASPLIADWVSDHVDNPVFLGPDSESEQWVADVAKRAGAPHLILEKTRHGDRNVEISVPNLNQWKSHTPVLVDDIISSGRTMLTTLEQISNLGFNRPYCIGVHGIFADEAYMELRQYSEVITTETIPHPSNKIEISSALCTAIRTWLRS
ncbi:MAG: ribose-phosphate pyrophosphokinase [Motiliproteus sp.]|nr:ribose-phosphate pyrophosphokinase [Motiliproteus sp.]